MRTSSFHSETLFLVNQNLAFMSLKAERAEQAQIRERQATLDRQLSALPES